MFEAGSTSQSKCHGLIAPVGGIIRIRVADSSVLRFDSEYHCLCDFENHPDMQDEYTEGKILCIMRFSRQVPELTSRVFQVLGSVKNYSVDRTSMASRYSS